MNTNQITLIFAMLLILAACAVQPKPEITITIDPVVETTMLSATPVGTIFNTAVGDLQYQSARFVEEVNGVTPAEDCKLLLVTLERPDHSGIDVQQFADAHMSIYIRGEDGSETVSTMGGLVGSDFAIGFQIPETIKTYLLIWGDNPPLEIIPGG